MRDAKLIRPCQSFCQVDLRHPAAIAVADAGDGGGGGTAAACCCLVSSMPRSRYDTADSGSFYDRDLTAVNQTQTAIGERAFRRPVI